MIEVDLYQKIVDQLTDEICSSLDSSCKSYYSIGINHFYDSRQKGWVAFQPAIGNLAISVELLLKSVIARKAIRFLYSNIPEEAQLLLSYPDSLSSDHKPNVYIGDLKGFVYKTIELNQCISLFYLFFPDKKQEFKHYFASLAAVRNRSIHGSIPYFQKYELEMLVYFSTKVFQFVNEMKIHKYFHFSIDDKTKNFLQYYEEEKVKRVKKAIEEATKRAKSITSDYAGHFFDSWEWMNLPCPVCDSDAEVTGETEALEDEDGVSLVFHCESLVCSECALNLEDYEELELAGMDTSVERDEDADQWMEENYYHHEYEAYLR